MLHGASKELVRWLHLLFMVTVVFGLSWKTKPADTSVNKADSVTLYCEAIGLGSTNGVLWRQGTRDLFFNGNPASPTGIPRRYSIQGQYNLVISNAQVEDDGEFFCSVIGLGQASAILTVLLPPGDPELSIRTSSGSSGGPLVEGNVLNILCQSSGGNPSPTILLLKNGQQLTSAIYTPASAPRGNSSSLVTVTIDRTDNGANYSCVVYNSVNSINRPKTISKYLTVQYGPSITFLPFSPLNIKLGHPGYLTCNVDANPRVTRVQWQKNGVPLSYEGLNMTFTSVAKEDTASYTCTAKNTISSLERTATQTTKLNVIYGPSVIVPNQVVANESSAINVTCNVDSFPPLQDKDIRWENKQISLIKSGRHLSLIVARHYSGDWTCSASTKLEPSGQPSEDVSDSATTKLVVQYRPGKASIGAVPAILTNETVTLHCSVNDPGVPRAQFEWRKGASVISTSQSYTIASGRLADNGVYTCRPYNILGTGESSTITVDVYEKPIFIETPLSQMIIPISKSGLSITCKVRGRPAPEIMWLKDNVRITDASTLYHMERTSESFQTYGYIITNKLSFIGSGRRSTGTDKLQVDDIGNYTCLVLSNATSTTKTHAMQLYIQFPPKTETLERVAATINRTVMLTCTAQAYPAPQFQWYRRNIPINSDSRFTVLSREQLDASTFRSRLQIQGVQPVDFGDYVCLVKNSQGNTTKRVSLTVKNRPESPSNVSLLAKSWESVHLRWVEGFDGGYRQDFYIHYSSIPYGQADVPVVPTNATTFNLTGLMPDTMYRLSVYGVNYVGNGNRSEILTVRTDVYTFPTLKEIPEFDVEANTITLPPVNASYCLHIQISKNDGKSWTTWQNCFVPTEKNTLSLQQESVTSVNISVCLKYRQSVCGTPYAALLRNENTKDLDETSVIIIGCVCAGIIVALLVVLVAILCRRNRRKAQEYRESTNYTQQPVNGSVPNKPKQCFDNQGMTSVDMVDLGDPSRGGTYAWPEPDSSLERRQNVTNSHSGAVDNRNGYPSQLRPNGSVPLDTSYESQLEKQMYENEMNRRNANLSDRDPYYDRQQHPDLSFHGNPRTPTKEPQQFIDLQQGGEDRKGEGGSVNSAHSGQESGYSTPDPAKPKKVIYEVVV